MTYGELQQRMSSQELELWMAFAMVRNDECPNCKVEPRDLMQFEVVQVRCPVCKESYGRVKNLGERFKKG